MSIIPGIETAAPERTETSSGSSGSPKRLPLRSSSRADVLLDLVVEAAGTSPLAMYARQASVVIVKPAGTGTPSCGHLGEADAFAAEELAPAGCGLVEANRRTAHAAANTSTMPASTRHIVAMGGAGLGTELDDFILGARARAARAASSRRPARSRPSS